MPTTTTQTTAHHSLIICAPATDWLEDVGVSIATMVPGSRVTVACCGHEVVVSPSSWSLHMKFGIPLSCGPCANAPSTVEEVLEELEVAACDPAGMGLFMQARQRG